MSHRVLYIQAKKKDVYPFIFTVKFTGNTTVTLPFTSGYTYNCQVNWGDGTTGMVTSYNDTDATHTYAAGTYTIRITGTCQSFDVNNGAFKTYIQTVIQWGNCDFRKLTFYGCSNLSALPIGPITGAPLIPNYTYTFRDCVGLTVIPADLFKLSPNVTADGFSGTFMGDINITGIPVDLFRYNVNLTTNAFLNTFNGCTKIAAIPADLFRYNVNVTSGAFWNTFINCPGITYIPDDLFKYNVNVTDHAFQGTFYNTSITNIPYDLFRNNTLVTSYAFHGTFLGTKITTIPVDLFRYNTLVSGEAFYQCFKDCLQLSSVPYGTFRYNLQATSFYTTFYNCPKLQLHKYIFCLEGEESTRFLNKSVSFYLCFYRTSFSGSLGQAPELWDFNFGSGSPVKTGCYSGAGNSASSLSNYLSIPTAWK